MPYGQVTHKPSGKPIHAPGPGRRVRTGHPGVSRPPQYPIEHVHHQRVRAVQQPNESYGSAQSRLRVLNTSLNQLYAQTSLDLTKTSPLGTVRPSHSDILNDPRYKALSETYHRIAAEPGHTKALLDNAAERGLIDIKPHGVIPTIGDFIPDTPSEIALFAAGGAGTIAKAGEVGAAVGEAATAGRRGVQAAKDITRGARLVGPRTAVRGAGALGKAERKAQDVVNAVDRAIPGSVKTGAKAAGRTAARGWRSTPARAARKSVKVGTAPVRLPLRYSGKHPFQSFGASTGAVGAIAAAQSGDPRELYQAPARLLATTAKTTYEHPGDVALTTARVVPSLGTTILKLPGDVGAAVLHGNTDPLKGLAQSQVEYFKQIQDVAQGKNYTYTDPVTHKKVTLTPEQLVQHNLGVIPELGAGLVASKLLRGHGIGEAVKGGADVVTRGRATRAGRIQRIIHEMEHGSTRDKRLAATEKFRQLRAPLRQRMKERRQEAVRSASTGENIPAQFSNEMTVRERGIIPGLEAGRRHGARNDRLDVQMAELHHRKLDGDVSYGEVAKIIGRHGWLTEEQALRGLASLRKRLKDPKRPIEEDAIATRDVVAALEKHPEALNDPALHRFLGMRFGQEGHSGWALMQRNREIERHSERTGTKQTTPDPQSIGPQYSHQARELGVLQQHERVPPELEGISTHKPTEGVDATKAIREEARGARRRARALRQKARVERARTRGHLRELNVRRVADDRRAAVRSLDKGLRTLQKRRDAWQKKLDEANAPGVTARREEPTKEGSRGPSWKEGGPLPSHETRIYTHDDLVTLRERNKRFAAVEADEKAHLKHIADREGSTPAWHEQRRVVANVVNLRDNISRQIREAQDQLGVKPGEKVPAIKTVEGAAQIRKGMEAKIADLDRQIKERKARLAVSASPARLRAVKRASESEARRKSLLKQAETEHARASQLEAVVNRPRRAEGLDRRASRVEAAGGDGAAAEAAALRQQARTLRRQHLSSQEKTRQAFMGELEPKRTSAGLAEPVFFHEADASGRGPLNVLAQYPGGRLPSKEKRRLDVLAKEGRIDESISSLLTDAYNARIATEMRAHTTDLLPEAFKDEHGQMVFTVEEGARNAKEGKMPPDMRFYSAQEFNRVLQPMRFQEAAGLYPHGPIGELLRQLREARDKPGSKGIFLPAARLDEFKKQMEAWNGTLKNIRKWARVQSLAMLALSPAWFAFQLIASPLAALVSHPNPAAWAKALHESFDVWRHTDPADRIRFQSYYGGTSAEALTPHEVMASMAPGALSDMYKASRVSLRSPTARLGHAIWDQIRNGGPLIRGNRAYEAKIRDIVALIESDKQIKDANRVMHTMGTITGLHEAVTRDLAALKDANATERLAFYEKHPEVRQELVQRLNDALGDWNSLTHFERGAAALTVFYPFLRFSLRWLFSTLPRHHPITMAALLQLSQRNAQEIQMLLGGAPSFFPTWGNVVLHDGPNGQPQTALDVSRAASGSNAILEALGQGGVNLHTLFAPFQPIVGIVAAAAAGENPITGQPSKDDLMTSIFKQVLALSPATRSVSHHVGYQSPYTALFNKILGKSGSAVDYFLPNPTQNLGKQGREAQHLSDLMQVAFGASGPEATAAKAEIDKLFQKYGINHSASGSTSSGGGGSASSVLGGGGWRSSGSSSSSTGGGWR